MTKNYVRPIVEAYEKYGVPVVDVHSHICEFEKDELEAYLSIPNALKLVGVSEDLESAKCVAELSANASNVIPCVGLHPWNMDKREQVEDILQVAMVNDIQCLGEIGLDTKFYPETFQSGVQQEVFRRFLEYAAERRLVVNLHAAGAWLDVLLTLMKHNIERAVFHWYTGPLDVLKEIQYSGYYVSINPAIIIQKKSRRVAEEVKLDRLLLESDGPYNYRGLRLNPSLIPRAAEIIAEIKGVDTGTVLRYAYENAEKLFDGFN
ncbi:MAG: TatD family hydrolase [Desulfurococcales archaeon]|nr:TatD family hydrolase [Desulfurococcales archaeon]